MAASNNSILGNFVGTNAAGTADWATARVGIRVLAVVCQYD